MIIRSHQPPSESDAVEWVGNATLDLHRNLFTQTDNNDFIGLAIHSENLGSGPVWQSFQPVTDFAIDDIWKLFENVAQSSHDFNSQDPITIVVVLFSKEVPKF